MPTALTIWILAAAYGFVQKNIADPINAGARELVLRTTPYPAVSDAEVSAYRDSLEGDERRAVRAVRNPGRREVMVSSYARRAKLRSMWADYGIVFDLIGLIVAIVLIYILGVLVGSYIGRRLYQRGERMLQRLPLVRSIYPSVKQVTDFMVGADADRPQFNRVVAFEYPRKGLWSLGLVTGATMRAVQERTAANLVTIFVPSSPTPFTGYVISVAEEEVIDLPITIEEAIKFIVSGGVLMPPSQAPVGAAGGVPVSPATQPAAVGGGG